MNTFKENLKAEASNDSTKEKLRKELEEQFKITETARYNSIRQIPEVQNYISNVVACLLLSHYKTYGQHTGVNMPHRIKAISSTKQKIDSRIKEAECEYTPGKCMKMTFSPISDYVACKMVLRNAPPIRYSSDPKLQELIQQCKEREAFLQEMQEVRNHFVSNAFVHDNIYEYKYDYPQIEYYARCREILEQLKNITNSNATDVLTKYDQKIAMVDQKIANIKAISAYATANNGKEYERKVTDEDYKNKNVNFFELLDEYMACMYDERDLAILTNQFLSLFKGNPDLDALCVSISKVLLKEKKGNNGYRSNFVILNTLIGNIEIQLQTQHQFRDGQTGGSAHSNMEGKHIEPFPIPDFNDDAQTKHFKDEVDYVCPLSFHAKMDDMEANRVLIEKRSDYQRYRGLLAESPLEVFSAKEAQEYWEKLYENSKISQIFSTENSETQGFIPYDIQSYVKSKEFQELKECTNKFHFSDDVGDKIVLTKEIEPSQDISDEYER